MLIKRKEIKRIPKKVIFAFLVEFKPDHWCLGVHWETHDLTFFNAFFDCETGTVSAEHWKDVLFTSSVVPALLRQNRVFKVDLPDWVSKEALGIPRFALRPRDVPYEDGQLRGWDGIWHVKGVDLVPLSAPFTTLDGADAFTPAVKENLSCEDDLDLLLKLPLSGAMGLYAAMERLECCRILGKNFEPYKAKLFTDCEALDQGMAKRTSWFNRGDMPLLGLRYDKETNRMVHE